MKKDFNKKETALLAAAVALAAQVPLAEQAQATEFGLQAAPKFFTAPMVVKFQPCFNSASIKPPEEDRVLRAKHKRYSKHRCK